MKNMLVTGGAGFIGSNFIHYMTRHEPDVLIINLDKLTYAGNLDNLKGLPIPRLYKFVCGDICNDYVLDEVFRKYEIDTVVHFAAETHVDRSIKSPKEFIFTNVVGTYKLLEASRKFNINHFHHISTDEVFGSLPDGEGEFTEESPYDPRSPYSASKASSDHLVRSYFHTYGLPVTISNCSNNYGARQNTEKLIPLTISNALIGMPLPVYGDGQNVRDWIYVDDHCEAIYKILKHGAYGETYLVGGGKPIKNIDLVNMICDLLDRRQPALFPRHNLIQFVTDRLGHDRRYAVDASKILNEIGWYPKTSFEIGIGNTIDWYMNALDKGTKV